MVSVHRRGLDPQDNVQNSRGWIKHCDLRLNTGINLEVDEAHAGGQNGTSRRQHEVAQLGAMQLTAENWGPFRVPSTTRILYSDIYPAVAAGLERVYGIREGHSCRCNRCMNLKGVDMARLPEIAIRARDVEHQGR